MDEVNDILTTHLQEKQIARDLGRVDRSLSYRVQFNKNEGILRANLELDLNKAPLLRNLLQNANLELILLLAKNAAINYSFLLNRLSSVIFLLSKVNLDGVTREQLDSLVSSIQEILQTVRKQKLSQFSNIKVKDVKKPLKNILGILNSWQNANTYYSKPLQSKL